jgi:hypothetical protein
MEGITPQGAGAVFGVASVADCTGIVRVPPADMDGPEKGPLPLNPAAAHRVFVGPPLVSLQLLPTRNVKVLPRDCLTV